MARTEPRSSAVWYHSPAPAAVFARQELVVSGELRDAWVRCAAGGPFAVRLNGQHLGYGVGPALTCVAVWERFELAVVLRPGPNVLVLEVLCRGDQSQRWLRAEGVLEYADGTHVEFGTGPAAAVRPADAWQIWDAAGASWAYLAGPEPAAGEGEEAPGRPWRSARLVAAPEPATWQPRAAAELEVFADRIAAFGEVDSRAPLDPAARPEPPASSKCVHADSVLYRARQQALVQTRQDGRGIQFVLDFGRVLSGYPRLRLRAPAAGGVVELGFGLAAEQLEQGLRYVSAAGQQEWTCPQLETCRYVTVRLWNWPEPAELDSVSLLERRVLVPTLNSLDTPEPLAAVWQTGHATVTSCRQEVYRLGPRAESADWLRLGPLALNGYALHADYQTAGTTLEVCAPPAAEPATAEQAWAWVIALDAHYQHSGDRPLLLRLLPQVEQVVRAAAAHGPEAAPRDGPQRLPPAAYAALHAAMLDAAARLARAAGKRDAAKAWEQARARVRRCLQRAWVPARGLFGGDAADAAPAGELLASAVVLHYGLARPPQVPRLVAGLRQAWPAAGLVAGEEDLIAFHLVGGLYAADQGQAAMAAIERSWGQRVERDGRTWGDKLGAVPGTAGLGPEHYLASQVLGVQPAAAGFAVLRIRSQTAGLDAATGRVLTPRGPVEVAWGLQAAGTRFQLALAAPPGGDIELAVPRTTSRFPAIVLNGETLWRNEKIYPNRSVREVRADEDRVTLVLQEGGEYRLLME